MINYPYNIILRSACIDALTCWFLFNKSSLDCKSFAFFSCKGEINRYITFIPARSTVMITDDVTSCKQQKVRHETKSSGVTVVLYKLWRFLWFITVHARKNVIYLCHTIKFQMVHWSFWVMKKEKQVRSRDMTWIWRHLCVCPLKCI